ncbi:MAG: glycerophosphodiester phosphodiesterase family protein [Desulfobacterales bacterium]|jgi:glycerophosphoryl diester phosphodiesterase
MVNINKIKHFIPPWVIAHRGYRQKYPENTLAAIQAAVATGVPMIELDVMFSRDRKVVVIHDETLERTTNGHGAVNDCTMEKLKQLDAGSWFDPRFADQRLPELSDVLELVGGRTRLNIEVKAQAYEHNHPPDAIEKQIVALVKQKDLQDSVLISSFEIDILVQIASMQDPPTIALISKTPASKRIVEICTHLKVFSWHPDHLILTPRQVDIMHAAGLKVFPYNVDTFEDFVKMVNMQVDGVITDNPVSAYQWSRMRSAA